MLHNMNVRLLTPSLNKKAEEELNEKSERILEDLNTFKTWISRHPKLGALKPRKSTYLLQYLFM